MKRNTITKHLRELVQELGPEYSIKMIDFEWVAYRKFGNQYDVEISGMNHNSNKNRANIFLWDIASVPRVVASRQNVPQSNIGDAVMELYYSVRKADKDTK